MCKGGQVLQNNIQLPPSYAALKDLTPIFPLIGLTIEGDPDLVSQSIVEDMVVVVASRKHPLFLQPKVRMESLLAYRWALPGRNIPSRQWLDAAFSFKRMARPNVQIEANSIPLLPRMIAKTDLLSFVPRHTLAQQRVSTLNEISLKETTLRRSLGVTYRREGYLSPAALRIVESLFAGKEAD